MFFKNLFKKLFKNDKKVNIEPTIQTKREVEYKGGTTGYNSTCVDDDVSSSHRLMRKSVIRDTSERDLCRNSRSLDDHSQQCYSSYDDSPSSSDSCSRSSSCD